jgi:HD-like signal output (HDOD) protein
MSSSPLPAALPDLAAWVAYFRQVEIPVLPDTADTLRAFSRNQDAMDARTLGEVIVNDPLMTLKLLAFAGQSRPRQANADAETVIEALVLMGVAPFFRAFATYTPIDDWLRHDAPALAGLQDVLRRANRAAQFALGFAVHRQDLDAAVIYEAALLHDFAEMLLWCHAPALALRMRERQRAEPGLRSCAVQREILHVELDDLQHALMLAWRLPALLVQIAGDREQKHPAGKTVSLGIRLARHTQQGWSDPALPDDVREIGELLNLAPDATLQLLHELD